MAVIKGTVPGGAGRNGMPQAGGYVYRGRGFDVLEAGRPNYCWDCGEHRNSTTHRVECLGLPARRPVAQCGTTSGYRRHVKLNETPCDPCREANNAYFRTRNRRQ